MRISEIQWKFTKFQWCYIDWNLVNFHSISETLTAAKSEWNHSCRMSWTTEKVTLHSVNPGFLWFSKSLYRLKDYGKSSLWEKETMGALINVSNYSRGWRRLALRFSLGTESVLCHVQLSRRSKIILVDWQLFTVAFNRDLSIPINLPNLACRGVDMSFYRDRCRPVKRRWVFLLDVSFLRRESFLLGQFSFMNDREFLRTGCKVLFGEGELS